LSEPLMVRETVAVETFASLATSLMFMEPLFARRREREVRRARAGE
jgi:hypothetical protein